MLILPLCSIYRHGGHDGWSAGSSDITFKGGTEIKTDGETLLVMTESDIVAVIK